MAYICAQNGPCQTCPHYRYDDDNDCMACFAAQDEKKEEK